MSDTKITYKDAEQAILSGIVYGTKQASDLVDYWNAYLLRMRVEEAEKDSNPKQKLEKLPS